MSVSFKGFSAVELPVSAPAAPLKVRARNMKQIVDEFRQHIHDSTEAATTETITLMNSATNDEVLQSAPAKRALGGRTATLLAWGGREHRHYQCSSAGAHTWSCLFEVEVIWGEE